MLELYSNIKKRRIELGMSQADLAFKVGYTDRSSIAKIEAGKVDISLVVLESIADALHTTSSELMGWDEENDFSSFDATKDAELLGLFHQLSPDQQDSVLNLIKSMIK